MIEKFFVDSKSNCGKYKVGQRKANVPTAKYIKKAWGINPSNNYGVTQKVSKY